MRIGIALDDWKLPIFRKRLTESGYVYNDAGALSSGVTLLTVDTEDVSGLESVVKKCQQECKDSKQS